MLLLLFRTNRHPVETIAHYRLHYVCRVHSTQHATKFRYETHLTIIAPFQGHIPVVYHPVSRISKITYYLRQPISLVCLASSHCVCVFSMYIRTNSDYCLMHLLTEWFCITDVESVYCAVRTESVYETGFVCKGLIVLRSKFWSCQLTTRVCNENITAEITWLPSEIWWTDMVKKKERKKERKKEKKRS